MNRVAWLLSTACACLLLAACAKPASSDVSNATAGATPIPSATSTSQQSATPAASVAPDRDSVWVYFTRDRLPPLGTFVRGIFDDMSPERRILARIGVLHDSHITPVPRGASNPIAAIGPAVAGSRIYAVAVSVAADTATVEFDLPTGWGVHGEHDARALIQQLVYVITEEPGVRFAQIRARGKLVATIEGIALDHPIPREEVSGYTTKGSLNTVMLPGDDSIGAVGATLIGREIKDGTLVRLTFEGRNRALNDAIAPLPTITATFARNDGHLPHNRADGPAPAYDLSLGFKWNATGSSGGVGHVERVDRSPLRLIAGDWNTGYEMGLDDARPWRMYMTDTAHLVVEIGGVPAAVNDRIVVTSPLTDDGDLMAAPGEMLMIRGAEVLATAGVGWRFLDATGVPIVSGVSTATRSSDTLWHPFALSMTVPSAAMRLEVYEPAGDGQPTKFRVAVPVVLH